jgi:hypothetical protein
VPVELERVSVVASLVDVGKPLTSCERTRSLPMGYPSRLLRAYWAPARARFDGS